VKVLVMMRENRIYWHSAWSLSVTSAAVLSGNIRLSATHNFSHPLLVTWLYVDEHKKFCDPGTFLLYQHYNSCNDFTLCKQAGGWPEKRGHFTILYFQVLELKKQLLAFRQILWSKIW